MIDPVTVMTAGHCVSGDEEHLFVLVGSPDICSDSTDESVVAVRATIRIGGADIARLTLEKPASVRPAPIAAFVPSAAGPLTAAGWGAESPGAPVRCEPRRVELAVTAMSACAPITTSRGAPGREICAVPMGQVNTCTGDSGGPVVDGRGSLIAVTSAGAGCGPADAGTYALVAAFEE